MFAMIEFEKGEILRYELPIHVATEVLEKNTPNISSGKQMGDVVKRWLTASNIPFVDVGTISE